MKNIDFLIDLDPDYGQISILCLYPNTELFNKAEQRGLIEKGKWEDFSINPSSDVFIDHWEEFLSTSELVELQKIGYRKFYMRPTYILRSILQTKSYYEFKTKLKGALKLIGSK